MVCLPSLGAVVSADVPSDHLHRILVKIPYFHLSQVRISDARYQSLYLKFVNVKFKLGVSHQNLDSS